MKRMLVRLLTVLMLGLIPASGLVTPASAVTRVQLADAASRAAFEPVTGGQFKQVRKIYPKQLNWTTDGCSVPKVITTSVSGMGLVLRYYSRVFHDSCVRHDFGYRNFGGNAALHNAGCRWGLNPPVSRRLLAM
ncbi:MAG: phospholipase [Propionicimonas sp.]